MKEKCKSCGSCDFYGIEQKNKCGNPHSSNYSNFQFSNVVHNCSDYKGEMIECDFNRSILGFGKECSTCNFCEDTRDYKYFCTKHKKGMSGKDACYDWAKKVQKQKEFITICSLSVKEAIEAIQKTEYVYYRHGVWNSYKKVQTSTIINSIKNSGYGADVKLEKSENIYYVSIPSDGDMF